MWRRIGTDGSYLAAGDARAHFGLGSSPEIERVLVEWPDGVREAWRDVRPDRQLTLERGTGTPEGDR